MADEARAYRYVGPAEILAAMRHAPAGQVIRTTEDLIAWLGVVGQDELANPFTFVVDVQGDLRLAPRRSEHVACAGGGVVLSAGEIALAQGPGGWEVAEVSNQSTGYCPEAGSWPAVEEALDRVGVAHPGRFTDEFVFRRCPECGERNVVKDGSFVCAVCDGDLPATWNFDVPAEGY
ncbi:hypothetical protein ABT294_02940 [Nonomuraea sp. NPDC000554]|uniref:hypothetical protein n=1 Tax=Nonomuraea sp. NPDC000554 TaxID=3154259 RepID=UPI00331AE824